MRKVFSILLLLFCVALQAQDSSVFHIQQIPRTGILLDKGWKFHAGDNLGWANLGFNDKDWQNVNPDVDIHQLLTQQKGATIGWFRLKITIDSSLQDSSAALIISQVVASEIYLNGRLLYRFGTVSRDYNREQTYSLNDHPFL